MQKKHNNILISCAIVCLFAGLIFLLFYPSTSELGRTFTVAIIYILVRNFALGAGLFALSIRLTRLLKKNDSILYILCGVLNVAIGLVCVFLYFNKEAELQWLHKYLLNLLIGTLIIVDTFFLPGSSKAP
jgi:hypothetical protein